CDFFSRICHQTGANHALGDRVVGVANLLETSITRNLLIAQAYRVASNGVVGQRAPQLVVIKAIPVRGDLPTIFFARRAGVEITQICTQLSCTQGSCILQAGKMLTVVVIPLGVVVLSSQTIHYFVVGTNQTQLFTAQLIPSIAITVRNLGDMSCRECQTSDVLVDYQHAFDDLRQQTSIVSDKHRGVGAEGTQVRGSTANTSLQGGASLVQAITGFLTVVLEQHAAGVIAMICQAIANATEQVHTKANRTLGEAGLVVQHEGLAPLAALGGVVGFLGEVVVTQVQAQLAVLDEIGDSELAHAQGAGGYGYSHGSFFHLFLLQFWFFEPGRDPASSASAGRLSPSAFRRYSQPTSTAWARVGLSPACCAVPWPGIETSQGTTKVGFGSL